MGQEDILEVLRNDPERWFTTKELCSMIGVNKSSCTQALKRLKDFVDYGYAINGIGANNSMIVGCSLLIFKPKKN